MRQQQFETFPRPVRDDNHQRLRFKFLINTEMLRVRLKTFIWLVLIGLYSLVGLRGALAQIDQGAISGTVTDSQGKVIPGHQSSWSTRKQVFLTSARRTATAPTGLRRSRSDFIA